MKQKRTAVETRQNAIASKEDEAVEANFAKQQREMLYLQNYVKQLTEQLAAEEVKNFWVFYFECAANLKQTKLEKP